MVYTNKPVVDITYLTEKGYIRLQAELDHLINVKRKEVAKRLHDAIDNEDLNENLEFMLAKEEQALVEGRIMGLERILTRIEIIKPGNALGMVTLGSIVTIQENGCPSETYSIVGTMEANSLEACISNESPMGQALISHMIGEEVEVVAPGGKFCVRIVGVA